MLARCRPTVFSLMKSCSATCRLVAPPAIRLRISISRLVRPPGEVGPPTWAGSTPSWRVDVLRGGGVGGGRVVVPERPVRDRRPFVDLCGVVPRLLRPVLPQRRLQRLESLGMPPPAHQDRAAGMGRPCAKSWGAECLGAGFQFAAMLFGLVERVARQRHLDGATQQPHPAEPVLGCQRDPQIGPRGLAVTRLAAQQRLTGLRLDAERTRPAERRKRAVAVTAAPAHLAELVVTLARGPAVDVLQRAAGGDQPVLEHAVVVGVGLTCNRCTSHTPP